MRPDMARNNYSSPNQARDSWTGEWAARTGGMTGNGRFEPEPSLGDLFSDLSQEASTLIRQEVELAKAEITQKATKAGKDLALMIGGGLIGYLAAMSLVAAIILGLSEWMEPWLAAFLVGAVLAVIAAVLIITGLNDLQQIDPTPRRTVATIKEDKEWLTRQMS